MKQGQTLYKIIIIVFTIAILVVFGVSAWSAAHPTYYTTYCYPYEVETTQSTTALFVREESLLTTAIGTVVYTADEGERMGVGQTVAKVYASQDALVDVIQVAELETQLALYQSAVDTNAKKTESVDLRQSLGWAISDLQEVGASGNFSQLEDGVFEVKSLVYQWGYSYGDQDTSIAIDTALAQTAQEVEALQVEQAGLVNQVYTTASGTFSSNVDGYETAVTPSTLATLTPTSLAALISGEGIAVSDPSPVGKLITNSTWYLACTLPQEVAETLIEGRTILVHFSQGWDYEVEMDIHSISTSEDGQCVVVLSTDRHMADTTLFRTQQVDLVFDLQTGLYIPKEALRVEPVAVYNSETEDWDTVQTTGVYVLVGEVAEFKEVILLEEGDDYCLVSPVDSSDPSEVLWSGEEIIISSQSITNGTVMVR